MLVTINHAQIELLSGDITDQHVDAIVNAANSRLAGGGGVDGAIHRCGGPTIMLATERQFPDGCPTGSAVLTEAGELAAKYVIHAVGPIWNGGQQREPESLASAYRRCLELAVEHDCQSIAFPSLSTGAYGYPLDKAAEVAWQTVTQFLQNHGRPQLVRFVLFGPQALQTFSSVAQRLHANAP